MFVSSSSLWIHLLILTCILYQKLHRNFPHGKRGGSCRIDWTGARHLRWNPGRVSRFPERAREEKRRDCRISWTVRCFERHNRCLPDWNDYSSVTVHAVCAASSLRIEAWILRWFTKSGLVCGNWLLDWQANYIKDKYTVYISPPLWQVGLDLGFWFPSSHRVCLYGKQAAGGVVWFLL